MLRRSSAARPMPAAPRFSCNRCSFVVPGIAGLEAELRRDHHPIPDGCERPPDELLVREGAIRFDRVEEGDALVHGGADQRDAVLLVDGRTVAVAEPHAPEADGRDLETASAECSLLH